MHAEHTPTSPRSPAAPRVVPAILHAVALAWTTAAALPAQTPDPETAFCAAHPASDESRWTLIPWRTSLTESLAEAKRTGKPIYLFVNDGEVESGLC
ncbi:MAG: hypothetical protein KDC87_01170 [Planctomycetes bacterium]|nr:hypothetical protein [Planctomycetota bacterium]MCB9869299.1 hypothetical protein [Planctomycetota bacterium]